MIMRVSDMKASLRFSSRSAMAPLQKTKRKRFPGASGSSSRAQACAKAAL